MPIANWTGRLSVGVENLDADHRHLIGVMNDVYDAMMLGSDPSAARKGLHALSAYVVEHFRREEEWMAEQRFADLARHQQEHEQFRGEIAKLLKLAEQGVDEVALELLIVLRDWLVRHIGASDQKASLGRP
jgi:hemerythrin